MKMKFLLAIAALAVQSISATTRTVPAGGDLQAALNSAQSGDVIQLAAGAQFTGHFIVPANTGSQWITIQSSGIGSLPAGTRVSSGQASVMAKIVTPDNIAAVTMSTGANYYRFQGIEFTVAPGVYGNDVIQVGNGGESSVGALPHDVDFDRDYIHGDPVSGTKRGIAMNGVNVTVENSYMSAFTSNWQDTQAIAGWNGPGPFKILNNYLEAGTEIVAFGGAVTAINGLIPSDILIQKNSFVKPLQWMPGSPVYNGMHVWAKNHIELKNAQRVTIDNNTFDNNWVGADQRGFVFVFNVRCEYGAMPWATVTDVKVTNNTIRHAAAGMVLVGQDGASNGEGSAGKFLVQNNVFDDINGNWGGDGRLFQIQANTQGITIDHNTAFQAGYLLVFANAPSGGLQFTNNITQSGWGNAGEGTAPGNETLSYYVPNSYFSNNVLIGGSSSAYPANNFFPGSISQVGFTNVAAANYTLAAGSPYKNAGTDGKDLGDVPQAVAASFTTGWFNLINRNSGKCLDIVAYQGWDKLAGTSLQQWTCWGGQNQQFQFTPVGDGYTITVRSSGMQFDVVYNSMNDGAPIIQYPYWGGMNEVFNLVPTGDGYYTIKPKSTGKCLDVVYWSPNDGAPVIQYSCLGGANQQYKMVAVP